MMLSVAAVVDEQAKREIKELLMQYDRTLLVADPRRCEPKKYAAVPFLHKAVHAMLSALHTTAAAAAARRKVTVSRFTYQQTGSAILASSSSSSSSHYCQQHGISSVTLRCNHQYSG